MNITEATATIRTEPALKFAYGQIVSIDGTDRCILTTGSEVPQGVGTTTPEALRVLAIELNSIAHTFTGYAQECQKLARELEGKQ